MVRPKPLATKAIQALFLLIPRTWPFAVARSRITRVVRRQETLRQALRAAVGRAAADTTLTAGPRKPLDTMSHVALARKWRPQRFEDVIGQRGVVEMLRNAIASGRLAQSFVFAGPRGVGKTTTARILARALSCINGPTADPCGECDACREIAEGRDVDVMEIDGATYTGVDAVREVIVEPLSIAPMRKTIGSI